LNEFDLNDIIDNQPASSNLNIDVLNLDNSAIEKSHNSAIEESYDSAVEDFPNSAIEESPDSALEELQDSQDSIKILYSQDFQKENNDLKMKEITLQKKKRAALYIDGLNSKVLKPFKTPTNDPEKIKLYKYCQRTPLKKATNNVIIQLPESDKPLNITLNISLNN
ncbi:1333_t:CDS:2, partial [Dentiscutata erythropus]